MQRIIRVILTIAAYAVLGTDVIVPSAAAQRVQYAIVIHGGAGKAPSTDEWRDGRTRVLTEALQKGVDRLKGGGTSLVTVETVIRILEDSPYFNAGKGAVFNAAETHELDATIMDGRTRACGAVGGVRTVRNPISLARHVMTDTRHILLVTEGAEQFAREITADPKIQQVSNDYFSTEYQLQKLRRIQEREQAEHADAIGTVGCVALDALGNLAAGTSTGGLTNKRYGRLGDSPIVGAGTFADNDTCAVSATGVGEDFIRNAVAYDVSARIKYRGDALDTAIHAILHDDERTVRGGLIGISRTGEISMQFNTEQMARAAANSQGYWEVRH